MRPSPDEPGRFPFYFLLMLFHVGLVRFLNIETDGQDPFFIFVF